MGGWVNSQQLVAELWHQFRLQNNVWKIYISTRKKYLIKALHWFCLVRFQYVTANWIFFNSEPFFSLSAFADQDKVFHNTCCSVLLHAKRYILLTVVSGRKAIVGLRHPVTIGFHISTEISKTSHHNHLKFWPLVGNTKSSNYNCTNLHQSSYNCIIYFYKLKRGRKDFFHDFFVSMCSPNAGRSVNDMWLK